jgi:hypothetical protein
MNMTESKPDITPYDMLAKQANYLEKISAHQHTTAIENQNIASTLNEILEEQIEQTKYIKTTARAADLYFWLAMVVLLASGCLLLLQIVVGISILGLLR